MDSVKKDLKLISENFEKIFRNSGDCYKHLFDKIEERDSVKFPKRACETDPGKRYYRSPNVVLSKNTNWFLKRACGLYQLDLRVKIYFNSKAQRSKKLGKCPICGNYLFITKETFFENRKVNILTLFQLIAISELVNFEITQILAAIEINDMWIESNYTSRITKKGEITRKRLLGLLKDLTSPKYRDELLSYGILNEIRHPKSKN